ncbi:MAG: hypothetical protein L0Z54_04430 [Thermoplasmata archaeon]|nr:hypothetical protein [Thermoplasmata archaeon]
MLRIVLGNTEVSVPPMPDDHPEIVLKTIGAIRRSGLRPGKEVELVVHTHDDLVAGIPLEAEAGFASWLASVMGTRAFPGDLTIAVVRPLDGKRRKKKDRLIVLTPEGEESDLVSIARRSPNATVLIGGFREGEFDRKVLDSADARVSLGKESLTVWAAVEQALAAWKKGSSKKG